MPDQDRRTQFLHPLGQDLVAGVRCPGSCPGFRVTYQADCACCGRDVAYQAPKDDSGKAFLSMKTKDSAASMPQSVAYIPPVADTITQPAPKAPRTFKGRHRQLSSITPVPRNVSSIQSLPSAGARDGVGSLDLLSGPGTRNSVRRVQQSAGLFALKSSSRKSTGGNSRRRQPAIKVGPRHEFNGVRTRNGVKGFLVEIRPPRSKKTIWLGTYTTDVEAAGAYDAGVFYTNKPDTKYNFRALGVDFPPLPAHLKLDRAEDMEEIKLLVQHQAKRAAAAAYRMWNGSNIATAQPDHHLEDTLPSEMKPEAAEPADSARIDGDFSPRSCISSDIKAGSGHHIDQVASAPNDVSEFDDTECLNDIPMDFEYLDGSVELPALDEEVAENMFLDYKNYQQQL